MGALVVSSNHKKRWGVEQNCADSLESMERSADEAISQLRTREYGSDLMDYDKIIGFGISFFRKRAFAKVANL